MVSQKRIRKINPKEINSRGPIIYWMSRDQRAEDNWAMLYAQELAEQNDTAVAVVFNLVERFLGAGERHISFMMEGIKETAETLKEKNIFFVLLKGEPQNTIPKFLHTVGASALITDFSPLKISNQWKSQISKKITIPFYEVDTHNIVPCWNASPKQEYAARTFRPKIHKLLPEFLTEFPKLKKQQFPNVALPKNAQLKLFTTVNSLRKAGSKEASQVLRKFIISGLTKYDSDRNNPNLKGPSELSAYLHFGQISAQRIALEIQKLKPTPSIETFLEELIVRKELSDNYCYYNHNYDNSKGFPNWALKTLRTHQHDKRQFLYTYKQLEQGKTHDELWNAAQIEMVKTGKMHGYMRMYWAKKLLEWTPNIITAQKYAIKLNDAYQLDGRDPNGYTGIAWSLGGVHDRPWFNRPIFGSIRYMSYGGAKSKFNITKYIDRINLL